MPKISVIIPVYNGERHIAACLRSLLNQTLTDWEAVFINDGSKDNTENILRRIADSDPRIKVISKRNEGVAVAREYGIKEASSDLITFLDIDDTLTQDAMQLFADAMHDACTDVAAAGFNIVSENGDILSLITYKPETVSGDKATAMVCDGRMRWQLWGKVFRKHILVDTLTPIGFRSGEDMAVCIQCLAKSRKVKLIDKYPYNYVQVQSSVTHAKAKEVSTDALMAARFVESVIGAKVGKGNINCLFLLIISGALRSGINATDKFLRKVLSKHCSIKALMRLDIIKSVNILLFKIFKFNIAKYL